MGLVVRQSIWNTVLSYCGILLGAINLVILYPKILGSEEFGLIRLLLSMIIIISLLARLGMDGTLIRYFPYLRDEQGTHAGALRIVVITVLSGALFFALLFYAFQDFIVQWFGDDSGLFDEYHHFIYPLIFSEVLFAVLQAYSRSLKRTVVPVFLRELVLRFTQLVIIIWYGLSPMEFHSFLLLFFGSYVLVTAILILELAFRGKWKMGGTGALSDRVRTKEMATYSVLALISGVAAIALGNMDQIMIGAIISEDLSFVAYYAVAFYIGSVIAIPSRAFAQVALPVIADSWKSKETSNIDDIYARSSIVQTVVGSLILLLIFTNLTDILSFLPVEYGAGYPVVLIVGTAQFLSIMFGINYGILSTSERFRVEAILSLALVLLNLVLNFVLIRSLGIIGAAWATFCSLLLVNIVRTVLLKHYYGFWPFRIKTIYAIAITLIGGYLIAMVDPGSDPWVNISIRVLITVFTMIPVVYLLKLSTDVNRVIDGFFGYFRTSR